MRGQQVAQVRKHPCRQASPVQFSFFNRQPPDCPDLVIVFPRPQSLMLYFLSQLPVPWTWYSGF